MEKNTCQKQKSELWEKQQSKTELKKAGTRRRNGSTAEPVQVLEQCPTLLIRIWILKLYRVTKDNLRNHDFITLEIIFKKKTSK